MVKSGISIPPNVTVLLREIGRLADEYVAQRPRCLLSPLSLLLDIL